MAHLKKRFASEYDMTVVEYQKRGLPHAHIALPFTPPAGDGKDGAPHLLVCDLGADLLLQYEVTDGGDGSRVRLVGSVRLPAGAGPRRRQGALLSGSGSRLGDGECC